MEQAAKDNAVLLIELEAKSKIATEKEEECEK